MEAPWKNSGLIFLYAKDKNFLYFNGKKIANSDPNSFKLLNKNLAKDNHTVYYIYANTLQKLTYVHSESFELIDDYYAKDKNGVYLLIDHGRQLENIKKITDANPKTFKIFGYQYATDNKHVYYKDQKLEDANPTTFVTFKKLGYRYFKDSNNNCYGRFGEKINISVCK